MLRTRNRNKSRVDIVPLIDVLTVLIFFFMVTMGFRSRQIVNIEPPEMKSAGRVDATEDIAIAINKNGEIFLNDSAVSVSELEQAVERISQIDNTQSVLIIADENSELKHLAYVFDCCKRHNLNKLRLQAR